MELAISDGTDDGLSQSGVGGAAAGTAAESTCEGKGSEAFPTPARVLR